MQKDNIKILIVEDDEDHAELLARDLKQKSNSCIISLAHTIKDARRQIKEFIPDIIVTDWRLPDGEGIEFVKFPEEIKCPVVLMTSYGDETWAVEAIKAGAVDYLVKSPEMMFDMYKTIVKALKEWNNSVKRQEAEKKLSENEEKIETILETAPIAIVVIDMNDNVTIWNQAAQKIFGWSKEEVLGKFQPIIPEYRMEEFYEIKSLMENGEKTNPKEVKCIKKNGELIDIRLYTAVLKGHDETIIGRMSILEDITELKIAENAIIKAKEGAESANKAKSEFLANMRHELITPMNGIIGMTNLICNTKLTDEQYEYITDIKKSSDHLLNIINDLLNYSKIESGQTKLYKKTFNIKQLIIDTVNYMQSKSEIKGLNVSYSIDKHIPDKVTGDISRIQQIIINLLDNAIKFTDNGNIKINALLKSLNAENLEMEFTVEDTGIGIPEDKLNSLFKAFSQGDSSYAKKYAGTGLGLVICYNLIKMMNGSIDVQTEVGAGSIFKFNIFLEKDKRITERLIPPIENLQKNDREECNLIVAEDDPISQKYIQRILKRNRFNVIIADTGKDVLEILKKNIPDLIIMDIQMPEMDGVEATKIIREKEKVSENHVPIIAVTAYALPEDKERFINAGMDDYLSKPFGEEELVNLIKKYLYYDKIEVN